MGLGYQGLQFVLMAKRRGIDFARTAMLGRQHHHLDAGTLRSMFERFGLPLSMDEEQEILGGPYSEALFRKLGSAKVDSIDASGYEGANIIHDLNAPIPVSLICRYTCVVDLGTLEHIFNFPVALKNATDLVELGGHFISLTTANNFMGHGFYQFSPELFFSYLRCNGFSDIEVYLVPSRTFPYFFRVADPRRLRERVELVNCEPVLLAVSARKASHVAQMVSPMQSDYLQRWSLPAHIYAFSVRKASHVLRRWSLWARIYERFWHGRDVNRDSKPPLADPRTAAALGDFKNRIDRLMSWPDTISPHFVYGFDNALHYQLMDPAEDSKPPLADPRTAASLGDFKNQIGYLRGWPDTISPHFVYGFDNARHYQLMDPAEDVD